jgi:hypothetical protein
MKFSSHLIRSHVSFYSISEQLANEGMNKHDDEVEGGG